MSSTIQTPSFVVNSRNRVHGSISSFDYRLELPPNNKFNAVMLVSATIPKSWYTINADNNTFDLREDGFPDVTITVPEGNYSRSFFITQLTNLLNTSSPNGWTYSIADLINPVMFKFQFSVVGPTPITQPSFIMIGDHIHEIMGFDDDTVNTFSGDTLRSTNMYYLQHTKYIVIKSNIAQNIGSHNSDSSILANISTGNFTDGQNITYKNNDLIEGQRFLANGGSNIFTFSIYDDHNRLLQMNGMNWKMKLVMWEANKFFELSIAKMEVEQAAI